MEIIFWSKLEAMEIVVQLETSDQKLLLQWQGEEMWGAETKPEDDHKVIVRELRLAVMTIRKL